MPLQTMQRMNVALPTRTISAYMRQLIERRYIRHVSTQAQSPPTPTPAPTSTSASSVTPRSRPSSPFLRRNPRPTIRVIQSLIHEPYFNIAYEERLFADQSKRRADEPSEVDHTLFLWCNRPCVIMGKHQNPYKEVHLDALRQHNVDLVRRQSGGGCVYQDDGNAIFTFISRDTPEAKDEHNDILVESLESLGIEATPSGRNDIEIAPEPGSTIRRKISGAAFKRDRGWLMHHGTMMINVDLNGLTKVLNPSKAKLLSKGVASVSARVVNLQTLDPSINRQRWDATLIRTFRHRLGQPGHSKMEVIQNREEAFARDATLLDTYTHLKSFPWLYGSSPDFSHEFSHRFNWGTIELGAKVSKGHTIQSLNLYSDSLQPMMIELMKDELLKVTEYGRKPLNEALMTAEARVHEALGPEAAANVKEYREWLTAQL